MGWAISGSPASGLTFLPGMRFEPPRAGMMQMMTIYMPLLMGYFAFAFSSGLALYLVVSNVLGIVQGVVTRRLRENATNATAG